MMNRFPLLRNSVFLIAGILTGFYVPFYKANIWVFIPTLISIVFILLRVFKRRYFSLKMKIGVLLGVLLFSIGYLLVTSQNQLLKPNHLIRNESRIIKYVAEVISFPEKKTNYTRASAKIIKVENEYSWQHQTGIVQIILNDSIGTINYGDLLLIKGMPRLLKEPENPHQFNYKSYLGRQNIYHQHFLKIFYIIGNNGNPIRTLAFKWRKNFSEILTKSIKEHRNLSVAKALVLGIRDDLDNDLKKAYSTSGAMHVLAVSGLHVGVLYGILIFIFRWIPNSTTTQKIEGFTIILILWLYAMVTGLSPSVLRAVTMFSFMAFARATSGQTNIYNSIFGSAILLLCYNPYLILSVGFQLSYLAVLGIVYLQPKINNWASPNNYILDKIWAITSVSIAAQLSTFPISIYYFHQFPTYFLLSNLLVIPAAFLILVFSLIILITSFWMPLSEIVGMVTELIISTTNRFIFTIDQLPGSKIDQIFISGKETLMFYIIIISFLSIVYYRKFGLILLLCSSVLYVVGSVSSRSLRQTNQKKITFYHVPKRGLIDFMEGRDLFSYSSPDTVKNLNFYTSGNRTIHGVKFNNHKNLINAQFKELKLLVWKGITIGIHSGQGLIFKQPIQLDYLVISRGTDINLKNISKTYLFKKLIIDTTNDYYTANRLKNQAESLNLDFHSIPHQGAYTIDY